MIIDRRELLASLGGTGALALLSDEAKADALEHHLIAQTNTHAPFPTTIELAQQIDTKPTRKGVGNLFVSPPGKCAAPGADAERPTLADFFRLRFTATSNHCLQSANHAMKANMSEEVVLACLLHDTVQELIKVDHGWWSAQMYEPYVSEKVAFAIRYHQALRFYEDPEYGYSYPDLYRQIFGSDYRPEPYIQQTYESVRKHKWYVDSRMVTVNDLYAFQKGVNPTLEQFTDIIGRHFRQPREGLGFDNSSSAHMWRSIAMPDHPL